MLPTCDPERLLSMSAFEAAFVLRRFRLLNPTYQDEQLIESIRSVRADFYPNDYDAGLALERIIPASLDGTSDVDYFKAAIEGVINTHQPLWVRLAPVGREYVLRAVSINGTQCFRNAGLLETPPGREVSDWWDALAARVRNEKDVQLLNQGREAERRSLEFERRRLRALGIDREPRWVSIEDNNAGYDILSYEPGAIEPINKIIEVKSSTQEPPRIIVTRGEWNAALTYGDAYVFQVWGVGAIEPIEINVASMAAHVPLDQGVGSWLKVQITIEVK
jgi:uncharacterized protein DUF3883